MSDGKDLHFHTNEAGAWVKCYHHCKNVMASPLFWVVSTVLAFPIEHYIWIHVWPFSIWGKVIMGE